jgi:hypothetical protein
MRRASSPADAPCEPGGSSLRTKSCRSALSAPALGAGTQLTVNTAGTRAAWLSGSAGGGHKSALFGLSTRTRPAAEPRCAYTCTEANGRPHSRLTARSGAGLHHGCALRPRADSVCSARAVERCPLLRSQRRVSGRSCVVPYSVSAALLRAQQLAARMRLKRVRAVFFLWRQWMRSQQHHDRHLALSHRTAR